MIEHIYLFFISLISNLFSAFSGGGAGVIQLPAILMLYNYPFVVSLASHKIATVALGVGASIKFFNSLEINKKFFLSSLFTGLPAVIIGAYFINGVNDIKAKFALGIFIILIALYSFSQKTIGLEEKKEAISKSKKVVGFLLIFLVGLLNGSLSAGTGLLFTISLVAIFGMTYKIAVAYTLIIVGFFYNLVGAITLATYASISWEILPSLVIGSLLGGYIGAHLSISKDNQTIKNFYQIVTLIVGLKLIYN